VYDGRTQLLIENPINRYLINSPILPGLKTNPKAAHPRRTVADRAFAASDAGHPVQHATERSALSQLVVVVLQYDAHQLAACSYAGFPE
jgi:hypothetical protein